MRSTVMKAKHRLNFIGAYGFWHYGEGLQTVLFSWYLANYAHLSADKIGKYQALTLAPFLVIIVFGGAVFDRFGPGRVFVLNAYIFGIGLIAYAWTCLWPNIEPNLLVAYSLIVGIVSVIRVFETSEAVI